MPRQNTPTRRFRFGDIAFGPSHRHGIMQEAVFDRYTDYCETEEEITESVLRETQPGRGRRISE